MRYNRAAHMLVIKECVNPLRCYINWVLTTIITQT